MLSHRSLARWFALLLVPVVVIATPNVGHAAANYNDWHRLSVQLDGDGLLDIVTNPFCEFPARYDADGSGVTVGQGKCEASEPDLPGLQVTEPGAAFQLEFKGERAGETGTEQWQSATTYCKGYPTCVTTSERLVPSAVGSLNPSLVGGSTGGPNVWIERDPAAPAGDIRPGLIIKCAYPDGTGFETVLSMGGGSLLTSPIMYRTTPWECITPGKVIANVETSNSAQATGSRVFKTVNFIQNAEAIQPGAGAGEPCSATYSGVLGQHPDDGAFGIVGTVPGGSAPFGAGVGGKCHVTEVCVTLVAESWSLDSQASSCKADEWGAPWEKPAPEEGDVDELAPVPDAAEPIETPQDEPSFWGAILNALASVGRAIGKVAGAVISGLETLLFRILMPHPETWGWDSMIAQAETRPPASVVGDIADAATGMVDGYSGASCGVLDSVTIEGHEAAYDCQAIKTVPNFNALYSLTQLALWVMTGLGLWKMFSGLMEQGN